MKETRVTKQKKEKLRPGGLGRSGKDQLQFFLLALPAVLVIFVMAYLPMLGVIIAFKKYRYDLGIFGSPWAGLKNFEFFFRSNDAAIIIRNSVCYTSYTGFGYN